MKMIDKEIQKEAILVMRDWGEDLKKYNAGQICQQEYDKIVENHKNKIEALKKKNKAIVFTTVEDSNAGIEVTSRALNKYLISTGSLVAFTVIVYVVQLLFS